MTWLCCLLVCSFVRSHTFKPKYAKRGTAAIWKSFLFPEAGDDVSKEVAQKRLQALESLGNYMPSMGLESAIYTTARTRTLLGNEISLVFDNFPGLYEIAKKGVWPKPRAESIMSAQALHRHENGQLIMEMDEDYVKSEAEDESFVDAESHALLREALDFHAQKPVKHEDVENALKKFRKVVGGLEKYRITNPVLVANHYRDMARMCLGLHDDNGDGWGSAANALEYAGFSIRSHVSMVEVDGGDAAIEIPVVSLESMWTQAAEYLLDLEFSLQVSAEANEAMAKSADNTFDQRFFGQMKLDEEGVSIVQDMMLSVMRISLRAVLSGEETQYIVVDVPTMTLGVKDWFPPLSAVKTVLSLDLKVLEEDEAAEAVRFFVAYKSSNIPSAQPRGIFDGI